MTELRIIIALAVLGLGVVGTTFAVRSFGKPEPQAELNTCDSCSARKQYIKRLRPTDTPPTAVKE